MKKNNKIFNLSMSEKISCYLVFGGIMFIIGMIFFKNFVLAALTLPVAILLVKDWSKNVIDKRKKETLIQFRDFIQSMNVSLKSSNQTLPNCFDDAVKNMNEAYSDKKVFVKLLNQMQRNIHFNHSFKFDDELMKLAISLGDDDILAFAMAIKECYGYSTSGISVIIDKYSSLIDRKRQINEEIITMVRAQRMEQILMIFTPSGMLLFFQKTMPNYLDCLYNTGAGKLIMAAMLAVNVGCYLYGNKISRI